MTKRSLDLTISAILGIMLLAIPASIGAAIWSGNLLWLLGLIIPFAFFMAG